MTKQELIENFIKQFRDFGNDVTDCFSNGMCWHFTTILRSRFPRDSRIVYDSIINHFATEIDGRIYDITGDITDNDEYHWEYWESFIYKDPRHTERIRRDCIWKIPDGAVICDFCAKCYTDDWGSTICGLDNRPVDTDECCQYGISKYEED